MKGINLTNNFLVTDTIRSPFSRLKPVPFTSIQLEDNFWMPLQHLIREVTLSTQYQQLLITGRIANFERVTGNQNTPFLGLYFNESDVYKWLEAAAYVYAVSLDQDLSLLISDIVEKIIAVQQTDGYLNTYFVKDKENLRWTDLKDKHELYCAGHLIQAAIAVHRCTGNSTLLLAARHYADLIVKVFGPSGLHPDGVPGHPEIEMALVELYRHTGKARYLLQSSRFLDSRGQGVIGGKEYYQDHLPFRSLKRMYGHAVRAVYLNAGAADIYIENGDQSLLDPLETMWEHLSKYQAYITGGIGSRSEGEAFGSDYELPNHDAYAETCAAIGKIFWAWRMLLITGDAKFADDIELTLYNAVLVGIGLEGTSYHYSNPLSCDNMHRRQPWYAISCCPTNIARLLASITEYFCTISHNDIWIHQYATGTSRIELPSGNEVHLEQETEYPWDGTIKIRIKSEADFSLFLRIPGWCDSGAALKVNGSPWPEAVRPQSYCQIQRQWSPGDLVELNLPMPSRLMVANPGVSNIRDQVSIRRGPLVYCLESVDHENADLDKIRIMHSPGFSVENGQDALIGMKIIRTDDVYLQPDNTCEGGALYTYKDLSAPCDSNIRLTAIPYFAWGNRDYGKMRVWIRQI